MNTIIQMIILIRLIITMIKLINDKLMINMASAGFIVKKKAAHPMVAF